MSGTEPVHHIGMAKFHLWFRYYF